MTVTTSLISLALCAVPLTYLLGAAAQHGTKAYITRKRFCYSFVALLAAVLAITSQLIAPHSQPLTWLSASPLSLTLLLLITFIGAVITRFSTNYLAGEARENVYFQNLYLTLAAVSLAVISNHMLVLIGAWIAISHSLHQLLMFYPDRPRAVLAAHKKFLLARMAELLLIAAAVMLYLEHGTWHIDKILAAYPQTELSFHEQTAAVLLALTALIKCAQLPIHGWLIQVVEAPTPVSALLHAGIINLGGYLLILFAPLLAQSILAQWLVLIVAGSTVLLAGLVLLTRVSVKVRLAWSTTAQMGLMLVECALGLYELALLHLVAHSCYKAHAFLNAGTSVEQSLYRQMAPAHRPGISRWIFALGLALALVALPLLYFNPAGMYSPWLLLVGMLTLVLAQRGGPRVAGSTSALLLAIVLVAAYSLQKYGAGWLVSATPPVAGAMADLWFGLLITLLFLGYGLLTYASDTAFGKRLWHLLFAGLYLDEWSTRITLAIWPKRIPLSMNAKQLPQPLSNNLLNQESLS